MTKKDFLEFVECFLKKTGMSATMLGIKAKNDPKFVFNLRDGTESREDTQAKIIDFINNYQMEE